MDENRSKEYGERIFYKELSKRIKK